MTLATAGRGPAEPTVQAADRAEFRGAPLPERDRTVLLGQLLTDV